LDENQSDDLFLEASYFVADAEDKKDDTSAFLKKRAPRFMG